MPTLGPAWNLVPRWRTITEPAGTTCPPNTFTPSIFGCESRPLRVEPPPFFCAMFVDSCVRNSGRDRADLELGVRLTMPAVALVVLAAAHLEDANLRVQAVRDHFGFDAGPGEERRACAQVGSLADRQDLIEHHFLAHFSDQLLDLEPVARGNLVLLAPSFDHRVHLRPTRL